MDHAHLWASKMVAELEHSLEMQQIAWNFLNDSLATDLCLRYPPRLLAAAAVTLALRFKKEKEANSENLFGFSQSELGPVEMELLKMYDQDRTGLEGEKKRLRV